MNQRALRDASAVCKRRLARPAAGGTMEQHPYSWLLQHLAVAGAGNPPIERYLDETPAPTARLRISAWNSDGQPVMPPCAHLRSPPAVAWTASEPVPQYGGPARTITPHFVDCHLITAPPQPLSLPPARQRNLLEDSAIP